MSETESKPGGIAWGVLIGGLVVLGALIVVLANGFGKDPKALPDVMVGQPAPSFQLMTLKGEPVSLKSLKGRPVVVNFWSTWCIPCRQEHPNLVEGAARYDDVVWLGVLYGDTAAKAKAFLKKEGQAFPTLDDPQGQMAVDYGVGGVPETFFIDEKGLIRSKYSGPLSWPDLVESVEAIR